jgi:hypothetical protein
MPKSPRSSFRKYVDSKVFVKKEGAAANPKDPLASERNLRVKSHETLPTLILPNEKLPRVVSKLEALDPNCKILRSEPSQRSIFEHPLQKIQTSLKSQML